MQCFISILVFLYPLTTQAHTLTFTPRSELNGPCTGADDKPGVCISTSYCTKDGGSYISNACPGTPDKIKCCTKPKCGTDNKGNCRFTSSCASGITETNKCPGPASFKCCMPGGGGGVLQHRSSQPPARGASEWPLTEPKPLSRPSRGRSGRSGVSGSATTPAQVTTVPEWQLT